MDDVANKHKTRIAKSTLKMSDAGALVMGGQTKDEARAHLKKMGHSDAEIAKLEESISEEFESDNHKVEHDKMGHVTITHKPSGKSVYLQGDDATEFRRSMNRMKTNKVHADKIDHSLSNYHDVMKESEEIGCDAQVDKYAKDIHQADIDQHKAKLAGVDCIVADKSDADIGKNEAVLEEDLTKGKDMRHVKDGRVYPTKMFHGTRLANNFIHDNPKYKVLHHHEASDLVHLIHKDEIGKEISEEFMMEGLDEAIDYKMAAEHRGLLAAHTKLLKQHEGEPSIAAFHAKQMAYHANELAKHHSSRSELHLGESLDEKEEGDFGYISFSHNGKQAEIYAKNKSEAHKKALDLFKPPKSKAHMVHTHLAERPDGSEVVHAATESLDEALKVGDEVRVNATTNYMHGKVGIINALNHAGHQHYVNFHDDKGKLTAALHFPESSLVKESLDENIEARYSDEDREKLYKHSTAYHKGENAVLGLAQSPEGHLHPDIPKHLEKMAQHKKAYIDIKNRYAPKGKSIKEEEMPKSTLINDIKQKNENAAPTIKNMLLAKVGQYVSNIKKSIAKESFLGENFAIKQAIIDHGNQMQEKLAKDGYKGSREHEDDQDVMDSLQKDLKNSKK